MYSPFYLKNHPDKANLLQHDAGAINEVENVFEGQQAL